MKLDDFSNEQYGLLFDVRRSVRYHDRRRAFYEQLHHITSLLTILMAGSVLFDLAKDGETAWWMMMISVMAAFFAATDMAIGYSRRATLHNNLRKRFADLEIDMLQGDLADADWLKYKQQRLLIEKDEPVIYTALDQLCRNELLVAEGLSPEKNSNLFARISWWQKATCQIWRWNDGEWINAL